MLVNHMAELAGAGASGVHIPSRSRGSGGASGGSGGGGSGRKGFKMRRQQAQGTSQSAPARQHVGRQGRGRPERSLPQPASQRPGRDRNSTRSSRVVRMLNPGCKPGCSSSLLGPAPPQP